MSESGDYGGSTYYDHGYDYGRARATYARDADRSYEAAEDRGVQDWDLLPESISTQADHAAIFVLDVTGSVSSWPITFRAKAPFMDHEVRETYFTPDTPIAFCAFGDAHNHERFPLQVRPFSHGQNDHTVKLGELVHTKQGGGQYCESSELAALYIARNVHVPNAKRKPVVIFITDEKPWDEISVAMARDSARVKLDREISTKAVFDELKRKFSVYVILKPYDESSYQSSITKTWNQLAGADHVAHLADEHRVVDVAFGIFAHATGKIDVFKKELEGRQTKAQVKTVLAALRPIFEVPTTDGRSTMLNMDDGGEDVGHL